MQVSDFNVILNEHTRPLKAFAFRFTKDLNDADDLYQDTILKAIRYFENFKEGTNLKAWLFTIMKNTFINDYRKEVRSNAIILKSVDLSSVTLLESSSKNLAESRFILNDVHTLLNKLPKEYSLPFILHFEGHKYHEIADDLDIPIGTVKTRIHMAREILKKQLKMYDKKRQ
ncbi:RNA polymerase sigma factor [Pedobacter boryungensis]|uniref:RNA polymerase sigma factor n=1 Tax=Pedobacter boryungensis TaxID=869962 RepID=A0ABX2DGB2_9SPHI|nr:RNA polymerase sigma factor [Pedobacter boryungensis]NQX32970.1 RNA polymerase sigma factor [Pedobacter boryungensis]